MKKLATIPYFLNTERTPLVDQLLDIVKERDDYIADLEAEINRLKKLPSKPKFKEQQPRKNKQQQSMGKRPGSMKEKKTSQLPIHQTHLIKLAHSQKDSQFKGYRHFTVQDILIRTVNHLFKCERWRQSDGKYIQADMPAEYKGQHFGPNLRAYILHQVYHQGVTRGLLLSQLKEWGVSISKGQLDRLLIQDKQAYHNEKSAIFAAGCATSSYLQVDDTGARHQGKNGYCTYIGNENFAFYESTFSKSRLNYLSCLNHAVTGVRGYYLDEIAFSYLRKASSVSSKLLAILSCIQQDFHYFPTELDLHAYLRRLGIMTSAELRSCTEAALFSPLKRFLFAHHDLLFLSDEAGQFKLPTMKHALCWLHIERKFKQLIPYTIEQSDLIARKQASLWALYEDLKDYKLNPLLNRKEEIRNQFDSDLPGFLVPKSIREICPSS